MALSAPLISVQNGPAAAAVNAAANISVFVDAGAFVTFALQSSTGVQQCQFVCSASSAGAGTGPQNNSVSPLIAASPFSWQVQMPNYPCQFLLTTEVTDGFNISTNTNLIIVGQPAGKVAGQTHRARFVSAANNESLTAFVGVTGGTARDGINGVQGDYVLLTGQTTKSQNGLYVIGVISSNTAPLTRVPDFATGQILQAGQECTVSEGTLFGNTRWFISTTGAITVDTTNHDWYPEMVTQSVTLTTGFVTVTNVPILSTTKTGIHFQPSNFSGATSTVSYRTGAYASGGAATAAGIVGTASASITALVAAGTFNTNDVGTGLLMISNR